MQMEEEARKRAIMMEDESKDRDIFRLQRKLEIESEHEKKRADIKVSLAQRLTSIPKILEVPQPVSVAVVNGQGEHMIPVAVVNGQGENMIPLAVVSGQGEKVIPLAVVSGHGVMTILQIACGMPYWNNLLVDEMGVLVAQAGRATINAGIPPVTEKVKEVSPSGTQFDVNAYEAVYHAQIEKIIQTVHEGANLGKKTNAHKKGQKIITTFFRH